MAQKKKARAGVLNLVEKMSLVSLGALGHFSGGEQPRFDSMNNFVMCSQASGRSFVAQYPRPVVIRTIGSLRHQRSSVQTFSVSFLFVCLFFCPTFHCQCGTWDLIQLEKKNT